jgi:hypothetical protein
VTVTNVAPSISVTKTASPANLPSTGGTVTYTVAITNLSSASDPVTITSLVDNKFGNLNGQGNCVVPQTTLPSQTYTCTFTRVFGPVAIGFSAHTNVVTATGRDDENTPVADDDDATVTFTPPIAVTNSSLCYFDYDNNLSNGRQFRRILTQDVQNWPLYKFQATNPGQFFYNLSLFGTPGQVKKITLELPWAFVTQGAMPVHVYDGVSLVQQSGQSCFVPGNGTASIGKLVALGSYGPMTGKTGYTNPPTMVKVELTITIPPTGFAYVNQHLDDGLKGPHVDIDGDGVERYNKGGVDQGTWPTTDASDPNFGKILLPELWKHTFTVFNGWASDSSIDLLNPVGSDTVQNDNEFKRNPGVGGQITAGVTSDGVPVTGATVRLISPTGAVVLTSATDVDGWYLLNYKHTGKAANFTIRLTKTGYPTVNTVVTLKANGFAEANFQNYTP